MALVLVAEAATHVFAYHADLFDRNLQVARKIALAIRDALGRRIYGEFSLVPHGEADPWLHLGVVDV
jgi:hypothetical protein